ncbi:MAG: hypothetical protein ABI665_10945 [Vicinamibacterales bacterium]
MTPQPLPTVFQLVRAIVIALVVATVVLLVAVLPAEYRLDPTGIGRRLGLLRPLTAVVDVAVPVTAAAAATVAKSSAPYRSDEMTLTLKPGEEAEIKATMKRGESYVFGWTVDGGTVEFDMHGEPLDGSGATSYWKGEEAASAHGTFHAPFDGRHGWFWQNLTWEPVTIRLKTTGYYEKIARQ